MTDKTPRGRCITTDGYRTWPERGTKTPPSPARAGAGMNERSPFWSMCPKCGLSSHYGPCPGEMRSVSSGFDKLLKLGAEREQVIGERAEITRLRRQNRRLRRKLRQDRARWDHALEVAARIAEVAGVYEPKVIAEMIRAVKVGSEDGND